MSDEFAKTLVIRDRSVVPGSALPNHNTNDQSRRETPEVNQSDNNGSADYPDFEDTSWLT